MNLQETVTEKFLNYIKIDTTSSETSGTHPSSSSQFELAKILVDELNSLGADDVIFDEDHCYIYAKIKGNREDLPKVGFIAHMDTSSEASGKVNDPIITPDYDGGPVGVLDPSEFPELKDYIGQTLICTDGTSLLGSDDKSGIAEIMTMAQTIINDKDMERGDICIAFTPDEEIGEGTEYFDIEKFGADFAYTVDGGRLGEVSYENFNAASAKITIKGRNVHPGEACGKMINSLRLSSLIDSKIPSDMRPETTKDREGFFHLLSVEGDPSETTMRYIKRDHDRGLFEKKKKMMEDIVNEVSAQYEGAVITAEIKDTYYNMYEIIKPRYEIVDYVIKAMEKTGVKPLIEPVRGGTDGAMLSYKGLLCPNICAGGHNFHGIYEFVTCESMAKITEILIETIRVICYNA